jgi:hypothetical protein
VSNQQIWVLFPSKTVAIPYTCGSSVGNDEGMVVRRGLVEGSRGSMYWYGLGTVVLYGWGKEVVWYMVGLVAGLEVWVKWCC